MDRKSGEKSSQYEPSKLHTSKIFFDGSPKVGERKRKGTPGAIKGPFRGPFVVSAKDFQKNVQMGQELGALGAKNSDFGTNHLYQTTDRNIVGSEESQSEKKRT